MIIILGRCVICKILVANLKVKSQHDLVAKTCLAHNFVIGSRILQPIHRNDHHIEVTCRVQHFGRYLEGQGYSMTLHSNRVRLITSLFEVPF